jgi:dihydrofolate reductase
VRALTVSLFVTLDGVVQGPGQPDEDTSGGFRHGGWQPPFWDDATGDLVVEWFSTAEDFLLGRHTYEIFEAWWPRAPQEGDPIATALNQKTKHVASRTLTSVDWNGTARLLEGDVPAAERALKEQDGGELQVHGSAGLVQTLLRERLVDELRLITYPVVLGEGKRLFGDGAVPQAWQLVSTTPLPAGAVASVYRRGGAPQTGEFTLESVPVTH